MDVVCKKENGIGLVEASGPLSAATTEAFREQLTAWQVGEADVTRYVLDMSNIDFMDSAGLGALVAVLKQLKDRGGDMKLACLKKKPRMVFEITRAYKVFDIFGSVEQALQAFED